MKHNRFFIISHDLSSNTNEQLFLYTRIVFDNNNDNKSEVFPYYPFYLNFKPYQIDFNYYGPNPEYTVDEDAYQELKHKTIFSLPLSFDYSVNDRLTKRLIEIYDEETTFDERYCYNPEYDFDNVIDKQQNVFSYNNLNVSERKSNLPSNTNKSKRIFFKTIFLDFLFDFNEINRKHNDFTYCPYFDEIETRLRQNDFFNALSIKYSYYYNHSRLVEFAEGNKGQDHIIEIQKKINQFKRIFENSKFREKIAEILPAFSPITSPVEKQIRKLLLKHKVGFCYNELVTFLSKKKWEDINNERRDIINEFVFHYQIVHSENNARINVELKQYAEIKNQWIKILEKGNAPTFILPENKWWKHFEIELENIYFVRNPTSRISLLDKDELNRIETAKWFSNRYDVLKSVLLILRQPFGRLKVSQNSINFQIALLVLAYFILLTATFLLLFRGNEIENTSSVILYISFSNLALIVWTVILLLLIGIINSIIYKSSKHYRLSILSVRFFMPRLLMAIISGWLFLAVAGEELWKFELDMKFKFIFTISGFLLLIMIFFLYAEIWKVNPKSWRSALNRVFIILYIGLIYSFIIGFFIIVFTSKKIIDRSDLLEKFSYNVIANNDLSVQRKSPFKDYYPKYKIIDENGKDVTYTKGEKYYTSTSLFKEWISDSLFYPHFVKEEMIIANNYTWNYALKKQFDLLKAIDSLNIDINPFGENVDSIKHLSDNEIQSRFDNSLSLSEINPSIVRRLKCDLDEILKLRKEAIHEINNSLINFNFPKPFLDDHLFADFLTNVSHNEDIDIKIAEKFELPFYKIQEGGNEKHQKTEYIIFPGYLILNSFLALFVGVFLQMIFDKKNIAEPL